MISRSSWHWKVFTAWYERKYKGSWYRNPESKDWPCDPGEMKRINLCPYMRAILFWSWLRWLFLTTKSRKLVGWSTIYVLILLVVGVITCPTIALGLLVLTVEYLAVVLALLGFIYVMKRLSYGPIKRYLKKRASRSPSPGPSRAIKFKTLLLEWITATHDKICPLIEIEEIKKDEQKGNTNQSG